MKKRSGILLGFFHLALTITALLLFYLSLGYNNPGPRVESVACITAVNMQIGDGPEEEAILPLELRGLPPRTPVTLRATIYPQPYEELYVSTKYCPGKVYLDQWLGYEFGKDGTRPAFMTDPAAEVHMIETRGTGRAVELTITYESPITRKIMELNPPLLGSTKAIILSRFREFGLPWILAAAQIIYAISLLFIFIATQFLDKKGVSFLWLGLLSLTTGLWAFGDSVFSVVIFKNSTLLYLFSFFGFFTFLIPLLRFARSIVDYENPRPFRILEGIMAGCALTACLLQLGGIFSFSQSMHFFYYTIPASLIFITLYTVREWTAFRNISARRFILPVGLLTASSIMGFVTYIAHSSYAVSGMTKLGILLFLLLVGVAAGLSLKDSLDLKEKQRQLSFEKSMMDIQIKDQKTHSQILSQQEKLLRQQRHDLRHHLNVIQALAKDENSELQDYLKTLMDNIPTSQKQFCENRAVNAIVSHYSTLCFQEDIELLLSLSIPENNPHVSDSMLCVIFGNLLEIAVEACGRMTGGRKFIKLSSHMQYDMMAITMDNSFSGEYFREGDRFRSSKRDDYGIGLTSVKSMAQKAGGNAEFQADGKVFLSSVYFQL